MFSRSNLLRLASYMAYRYIRTYLLEIMIQKKERISELLHIPTEDVSTVFDELNRLRLSDRIIQRTIEMRGWWTIGSMDTPARGPILYILCRLMKPKVVIETGVAAGVSSFYMLEALHRNGEGHLYSIDYPDPSTRLPTGWLVPRTLHDRWTVILGKSSQKLKSTLEDMSRIDLFLHDSDHSYRNMTFEFRTAWPYIRKGGLLLSDDTDSNRSFFDFADEVNRKPVTFCFLSAIRK
jgi:predicted O-methyltransferase YrrM